MALRRCGRFVDMRVTWQIGVTSMNALGGAVVMITSGAIELWAFA